jgi:acyl-CoA synthetase (NDP forming)
MSAQHDLTALLEPRSIAMIGVSRREDNLARRALRNLRDHGYRDAIYVIHPSAAEIDGFEAVPSIADLDPAPNLGVICTDGDKALGLIEEAAEAGVEAFVVLAGTGTIVDEAERLREILDRSGARLLGPNSPGFVSASPPVAAHISHFLSRRRLRPAPLGVIAQSGAVGGALADRLLEWEVGLDWLICTGNEQDLGAGEALGFLAPRGLAAVGLFLETVRDLEEFRDGLDSAAASGTRVLAVKVGESAAGQRQALTHSGALTGMSELFAQELATRGGSQCADLDELYACLAVATLPPPTTRSLAVAATSGGLAGLLGDLVVARGMDVPELRGLSNPWDTEGVVLEDPRECAKRWAERLADAEVGAGVLGLSALGEDVVDALVEELTKLDIEKPFVIVPAAGMEPAAMARLAGVAVAVPDARSAVAALAWWTADAPSSGGRRTGHGTQLTQTNEAEAKAELRRLGLVVPDGKVVRAPGEAFDYADGRDGPFVLKCLEPALAHKAAAGGVRLGLAGTAPELSEAWDEMSGQIESSAGRRMEAALIEEQIAPGLEFLLAIGHDPDYGPYLTLAAGGSKVEQDADIAHRLLPSGKRVDFAAAFAELRIAPALEQAARLRGEAGPVPMDLLRMTEVLADLAAERPGIGAEINPVILPLGGGPPVAVDCILVPAGD